MGLTEWAGSAVAMDTMVKIKAEVRCSADKAKHLRRVCVCVCLNFRGSTAAFSSSFISVPSRLVLVKLHLYRCLNTGV